MISPEEFFDYETIMEGGYFEGCALRDYLECGAESDDECKGCKYSEGA